MDFELEDKIQSEDLKNLVVDMIDSKSSAPLKDKYGNLENLSKGIDTDLNKGLPEDVDFNERTFLYGKNVIVRPPIEPIWKIFISSFADPMLVILIILAVVSIVLETGAPFIKFLQDPSDELRRGELPFYLAWIEGCSILLAVLIVSVVCTINDYQKERKFQELQKEGDKFDVKVVRGGKDKNIEISKILVGDVVRIEAGDKICADGILIQGYDLRADESSHSGEGKMVKKSKKNPIIISGTQINRGFGKMVVVAVGKYSRFGETMEAMLNKPKKKQDTPLQEKLDGLAKKIAYLAFFSAFLAFAFLCVGAFLKKFFPNTWVWRWNPTEKCENVTYAGILTADEMKYECASIFSDVERSITFIIFAVVLIVAAVPEGLPLAVTISLAYSVKLMLKDKNLVRKLVGCETMGSVTTICSDKTGTLTQNEQHVFDTWVAGKKFLGGLKKFDLRKLIFEDILQIVIEGICVNSTANIIEENEIQTVQGCKTESALLFFVKNHLNVDYKKIRNEYELNQKIKKVYPFSSSRKKMSTIIEKDGSFRLYCKGASEIVLKNCTMIMNQNGDISEMSENVRNEIIKICDDMSSEGLRILGLAFRDVSESELNYVSEDDFYLERNLVLYQIVGIKDPLRENVVESVRICQNAGINVKMVTGDNLRTAQFIARECGILREGGICLEGKDFRNMSEEDVTKTLPKLEVLARSSPSDKLRLVEILKSAGEVVSVTGDGTNDAPALQAADVGLSMGISGTQVAKAASDIIILDDDFSSIVKTVLWGRSINDNIRKFLQFQLTVNFVACIFSVICALTNFIEIHDSAGETVENEIPFTAIQLLWVNLIMDTLAALALATEKPVNDLLNNPPISKKEFFINWNMWASIFVQTCYQLLVLLMIHFGSVFVNEFRVINYGDFKNAEWNGGWIFSKDPEVIPYRTLVKDTLIFNTFVFMQIFNEICCRRINLEWNIFQNIHKNFMWLLIFFGTIIIQIVIVQIGMFDFGNMIFQTTGLTWFQWMISVGFGMFSLVIHFLKNIILKTNRYLLKCKE